MHIQKNRLKGLLMTLAVFGLVIGIISSSAWADDKKDRRDDRKHDKKFEYLACYDVHGRAKAGEKVSLYSEFEWGTHVYVGELKLLCVPTDIDYRKDKKDRNDKKDRHDRRGDRDNNNRGRNS